MTNRPRLLLAGGGYADIPMILAAQKLGYYVISTGNNRDDLGHIYSDEYCYADFSSPEAMLKLAKDYSVSALCPSCNDFSALSCAYVAEELGLPGHDALKTAHILHLKDRYREFALDHGIQTPQALGFTDLQSALSAIEQLKFPLIIKPVDLTGGKGISTVTSQDEFTSAVNSAFSISRAKRIVVEEFIHGTRHGFSAIINNGKVIFSFIDNEYYYLNPYLVAGAFSPPTINSSVVEELKLVSEKISSLLNLKSGLFHLQFILRDNKPFIIEICRRPPGDLYVKLVQYVTGIDYPEYIIRSFAGLDLPIPILATPYRYIARHCMMAPESGIFKKIHIPYNVQCRIIDKMVLVPNNMHVDNYLSTKLGILFIEFSNQQEMLKTAPNLHKLIRVEMR